MPLVATRGAASAQGFGEFARVTPPIYIEDVFSTYLYTGTGSSQTITNGIDLSGKGGLVWLKSRSADSHYIVDTARGSNKVLYSNLTIAEETLTRFSSFNSNGFSLSTTPSNPNVNGDNYASWTFRKQAKFFDVVTYTGNGSNRTIAHNLGSTPGCIIVKAYSGGTASTLAWQVYHRSVGNTASLYLNYTDAAFTSSTFWNNTSPTSTQFSLGTSASVNENGTQYVAYLFAHDAGGFGAAGTDNVISCGSFTDSGADQSINLGYEPQWILVKRTNTSGDWWLVDNMRGMPVSSVDATLKPNTADAEQNVYSFINPEATGFRWITGQISGSGQTFIYIAIRRGPMKTPTSGTSVFSPNVPTGFTQFTTGFPVDLGMWFYQPGYSENTVVNDRLRGVSSTNSVTNANNLVTSSTAAEAASQGTRNWNNTGLYAVTSQAVFYSFRRAPGFFDVVCYTGTGSATTFNHNLTVVPELMIVKSRNNATNWAVYCAYLGGANPANRYVLLNSSNGFGGTAVYWNDTAPTSTVFTVGTTASTNTSSYTYVNYLFATVAGVSKVGSYTGTGTTKQIDCGFTAGARFVMIKRTDSTGDWYVWDSARGIVAGNDPYLLLNSTAAEVTNTDYVDTYNAGFEISSTAPAGLNAVGGTYIFLAIS